MDATDGIGGGLRERRKIPDVGDSILGIEDLLGRYEAAGETDSSGTFTMNREKAFERLAEFQLPTRYHWILKLIQSLHLSGATSIEIDAGIKTVRFGADAVPDGLDSLDDLLAQLLVDTEESSPALRHLAAGLQGSLAVRPNDIFAIITQAGTKRTFVLSAGGWREEPKVSDDTGSTYFQLRLERNVKEKLSSSWFTLNTDIFDLFFSRRGAYDRENAIVYDACPFAHCRIHLSGKLVSQRDFGLPRFPGYNIQNDMNPGASKPSFFKTFMSRTSLVDNAADRRHHLVEEVVPSEKPGGFQLATFSHATWSNRSDPEIAERAKLNGLSRAYALRMELSPLALLVFVEDGVIIQQQTMNLSSPVPESPEVKGENQAQTETPPAADQSDAQESSEKSPEEEVVATEDTAGATLDEDEAPAGDPQSQEKDEEPEPTPVIPCKGLVALIDAKPFRKDLTTLHIVEDEKYDRLVEELQEVALRLRNRVAENLEKMPGQEMIQAKLLGSN